MRNKQSDSLHANRNRPEARQCSLICKNTISHFYLSSIGRSGMKRFVD